MIGAHPFFKKSEKPVISGEAQTLYGRNGGVRKIDGNPRFGFQTMLGHKVAPLPTAPAVVGGNTDWTTAKSSPMTQYLHSVLSVGRPMNPAPALGSVLRLGEPTVNSIHTTY